MIADTIVMFFCDVGGKAILQPSDYNMSFVKVFLLFIILVISIVVIDCALLML